MKFPYIPRGDSEIEEMFKTIGVSSFEELLAPVDPKFLLKEALDLPPAKSELEVDRYLSTLAALNHVDPQYRSFLGAGAYDHMVPTAVDHVSSRSEFYTAYTPYQPEVGQGTLTTIFEFQTMMLELTGMDVANASLYDGASALAEAVMLSVATTKRKRVLIAGPIHSHYLQVLETYCKHQGITVSTDPAPEGGVDFAWVKQELREDVAAVVAESPNIYGIVEDHTSLFQTAREAGALGISVFQPQALVLYKTPGEMGADLAVGEGRSLGSHPQYGGPALGLFACSQKYVRYAPGRLIGETVDRHGKRAYVMTLQTREQHIRRAKATSNICTNQALLALRATIYLSLMGPTGMLGVAEHCAQKAHYLAGRLKDLPGFSLPYDKPFFREFVLECPRPAKDMIAAGLDKKLIPGVDLGRFDPAHKNRLLVCCSEKHTRQDLDDLVEALKEAAQEVARV